MRGNVSRAICLVAVLVMKTAFADYSYSVFAWDIRKIMKQRGASVEQAAELLKDAGVTGFDASCKDPQIPDLVACGLKAVNLFGDVPCRDGSGGGEVGEAFLATAVRYGAKCVMVFPEDFAADEDKEHAFAAMAVGLEAFARKTAAAGVQTTIEDFGAGLKNPCSYGLYLKRFLKECPHVALALDSGNLYYAGRGDDILDVMDAAGDRIGHVHLKDQAHGDPRSFVTLGTGAVPNREILRRLAARSYKGWITIENPVGNDLLADVRRQIAFVQSVARVAGTEFGAGDCQMPKNAFVVQNCRGYNSRPMIQAMGDGEALFGNSYRYEMHWKGTDWPGTPGNEARPFAGCVNGHFKSGRWRMEKGGSLTWRHELGGRRFSKGRAIVTVACAKAPWVVEAATDGADWRRLSSFTSSVSRTAIDLPDGTNVLVRIRAEGDKGFDLENYAFEAIVDGARGYRVGRTDLCRGDGTVRPRPNAPKKPYANGARLPSSDGALRLWSAAAGWKVFPENPLPTESTDAVRIQTAANETECAQLVVTPTATLDGVRVRLAVAPAGAGGRIPAEAVEVLLVSYVNVAIPTDATCAPGRWPDPLERQTASGCRVEGGESQVFWVRVKPPKGTAAGVYRGALELAAAGHAPQRVAFEVEVFGFELPDVMTCETAFGCRMNNVVRDCHLKTLADRRRAQDVYFRIMADHHLSVYNPDPTTPLKVTWKGLENPATAEPVFNWKEWDAVIARALDDYHMNTFEAPVSGLGGGTYEQRREPEIAGFKEGTPEYEILIGKYLSALEAHVAEKGWLDHTYVYWFDEPSPKDYDFVTNGFARLKSHAPRLRRMLTAQAAPKLMDSVNLWCPVTPDFHKGEQAAARQRGDTFWWYVCCAPHAPYATEFIDKPGTEMRVWLWQTWKEGVSGILIWDSINWSSGLTYRSGSRQNCWDEDTQCWCDSQQYAWGNGDGRLIYPPRAAMDPARKEPILDPPVETYRLEMLRDGLEDYEYFAMLRRLDPSNALLSVPTDVTASMTDFTRDPSPITRHRLRLAREIVRLKAR